ncbi:bifunctional diguanylate cyclase/phosphodiesterase [Marinivivus vitaminiproducens]|uniref:bifunctional diguanylate cyclase/phosphodiesterase n=1 Tax=Marinivivus vitaminiproducens TaxID=3035935 RepID=UPI00279BCD66|nr:EAL domain-containing protein [Geminicoccaceae bacterium SCSIO 64248]
MLPTLAITLAVVITLTIWLVADIARRQNTEADALHQRLVELSLADRVADMRRTVLDYADWGDAYRNLHPTVNTDWALTRNNLGHHLYEQFGYDLVFVLGPDDRTGYAVIDGEPADAEAGDLLGPMFDDLIRRARLPSDEGIEPVVDLVRAGDQVAIVAVSVIGTGLDKLTRRVIGPPSLLVFGSRLRPDFLTRLGQAHLVQDLRLTDAPAASPAVALTDSRGETLGRVTWLPERPGDVILMHVLPILVIVGIGLVAFALVVFRNVIVAARAVEANAEALSRSRAALAVSEARFRDVAEASSDWIWETDAGLRLTYLSTRFEKAAGLPRTEILGTPLSTFLQPFEDDEEEWDRVWRIVPGQERFPSLRCRFRDARGRERIAWLSGRPILDQDGNLQGMRGTATDITVEIEAEAQVRHLSLHDNLTGLPNRLYLTGAIERALIQLPRNGQVALIILNLDRFKPINDAFGHAVGDLVLRKVSERLRAIARPSDVLARLGGDEFALVRPSVIHANEVGELGRAVLDAVCRPLDVDGQDVVIGVSLGAALAAKGDASPSILLRHADIALHQAKQEGGNRIVTFKPEMDRRLVARRDLERDLRQAVEARQLVLHYQPRYAIDGMVLTSVEALLRWPHAERGLVEPEQFVALAEETGLILPIGSWVLETACAAAARWRDLQVSVNLSPAQFRLPGIVGMVTRSIEKAGLPPDRLELEITESLLIDDTTSSLRLLGELKRLGIRLAMDDFGTGYSSLSYLHGFPFDRIKIDRRFIHGIGERSDAEAIVRAILALGRGLGMAVTAEGVENAVQLDFLRSEGCDEVQGFLLAAPTAEGGLGHILERHGLQAA